MTQMEDMWLSALTAPIASLEEKEEPAHTMAVC